MNLNKKSITEKLCLLAFDPKTYWLVMGSSLVFHELKEITHDIDIGCSSELFDILREQGFEPVLSRAGKQRIDIDEMCHVYLDWNTETELIDGIQVATLQAVLKDKKYFNRKKDIDDIILIQKYLKENN